MAKKSASTKTAKRTSSTKAKASPKSRKSNPRKPSTTKAAEAGDKEVTIDRRRQDKFDNETAEGGEKVERREKVQRRRQIDPTTCERDYTDHEVEFMNALDEYKRTSGRMFPTCSEVLEVIRGLGYVQLTPAELATRGGNDQNTEELAVEESESSEEEFELAGHSQGEF